MNKKTDIELEWQRIAMRNNMGISATERLIEFCLPGLNVRATRDPRFKHTPHIAADVAIPNLHTLYDQHVSKWPVPPYQHWDDFLEALKIYIPGEITEEGIYTNIRYSKEAIEAVVTGASSIGPYDEKRTDTSTIQDTKTQEN